MDKSLYIYIFIHASAFLCMRLSGHNYSIVNTPSQDRAGVLQRVRLTSKPLDHECC